MLSERSQTHKNTYFIILFIGGAKIDKKQVYIVGSQNDGYLWGTINWVGEEGASGMGACNVLILLWVIMYVYMCKKPVHRRFVDFTVCMLNLNCFYSTKLEIRIGLLV